MSWDGYLAAHTWVALGGRWWHLEPGDGEDVLLTGGHVITAHNPGGRWLDDATNAARHAELVAAVGDGALPSWGGSPDGHHLEEGVFVIGLDDVEARDLGRRFGQDAIYALAPGRRRLLPCDGSPSTVQPVRASSGEPPPQPGRT